MTVWASFDHKHAVRTIPVAIASQPCCSCPIMMSALLHKYFDNNTSACFPGAFLKQWDLASHFMCVTFCFQKHRFREQKEIFSSISPGLPSFWHSYMWTLIPQPCCTCWYPKQWHTDVHCAPLHKTDPRHWDHSIAAPCVPRSHTACTLLLSWAVLKRTSSFQDKMWVLCWIFCPLETSSRSQERWDLIRLFFFQSTCFFPQLAFCTPMSMPNSRHSFMF